MDVIKNKKQVLWILPNYNFYNIQRLNLLTIYFDILVIAGKQNDKLGFKSDNVRSIAPVIYSKKYKDSFGKSFHTIKLILSNLNGKDFVYLAVEKKNLLLLLIILFYRFITRSKFELFSYNHFALKSKKKVLAKVDVWLTKFFYRKIDRVIFYTEESCKRAVKMKMINKNKAYWANNTIDTTEVDKYYQFELPPKHEQRILFIGRLITSKRIDDLIAYYEALHRHLPNLYLDIIGDGPEGATVNKAIKHSKNIIWHGTLVDEAKIAPVMARASIVFVPGLSGLSINHALAYGRPYITLAADKHGPEISYLNHNENGYLLQGDFKENIKVIANLLNNNNKLEQFSYNAMKKGKQLSVDTWVQQIKQSLANA